VYRPWVGRNIGVEMELTETCTDNSRLSSQMIATQMRTALGSTRVNSNVGGWYHSDGSYWDVKRDGSCGHEVASPVLRMETDGNNRELKIACNALTDLRPVVDRRCGLHVHLECRDYTWQDLQRLMSLWVRYEPFMFELMPVARRNNSYARYMARRSWGDSLATTNEVITAIRTQREDSFRRNTQGLDRYMAMNLAGWWRHQRIEIRLHSGTVNYTKVRNWSLLLLAMAQRVKESTMPEIRPPEHDRGVTPLPTSYILKQIGLLPGVRNDIPEESVQLSAWLNARRLQFTPGLANTFTAEAAQRRTVAAPAPAPPREERTRVVAQINLERARDTRLCAAAGLTCTEPREEGYVLCVQHRQDYLANRGYLLTQPAF
jgi:aryl carrier-like protein